MPDDAGGGDSVDQLETFPLGLRGAGAAEDHDGAVVENAMFELLPPLCSGLAGTVLSVDQVDMACNFLGCCPVVYANVCDGCDDQALFSVVGQDAGGGAGAGDAPLSRKSGFGGGAGRLGDNFLGAVIAVVSVFATGGYKLV
jgi:hypothetical protein